MTLKYVSRNFFILIPAERSDRRWMKALVVWYVVGAFECSSVRGATSDRLGG
jgi:hypothetical protein